MNEIHHEKTVKIIMLGNFSVGKTSLVKQFYNKSFKSKSKATIGANYVSKKVNTQKGEVTLNIWDTAGEEKFRSLLPMYTRGGQAAIVVFNIHDEDSFKSVPEWIDLIQKNELYRCKIYIVANQVDLGNTNVLSEARSWVNRMNYRFFVTSAKDYESVAQIFQCVAEELNGSKNFQIRNYSYAIQNREKKGCC